MRVVSEPAELAQLFGRDRAAHAYGLADLESPLWDRSTWFRRDDATAGIVTLGGGITTVYAISLADPAGSLALVVDLLDEIPHGSMITGPVGLAAAVGAVAPINDLGLHVKCVLTHPERLPNAAAAHPLAVKDFARVASLHATNPGAAFVLEPMLVDDTFVGIAHPDDPDRLIAAAGTHVLSTTYEIAAVGAVFVDPAARGQGLGAIVTAGVCKRLDGRVSTIGLNVDAGNLAARRTYERIGFVDCLEYEEVIVRP
ncbi:MAG: GNAT superfamily N-acetyltransferase [Candidatus Aldehydirespiratoraceae bacterium]|jgi:GNAT superfamily N-acetyltransferase